MLNRNMFDLWGSEICEIEYIRDSELIFISEKNLQSK